MRFVDLRRIVLPILFVIPAGLFLGHVLISPEPPHTPSLSSSADVAGLLPTVRWYIENAAPSVTQEVDSCVAHLSEGKAICDTTVISFPLKEKDNIRAYLRRNHNLWPFIWRSPEAEEDDFSFNLLRYEVKSIKSVTPQQTVLGKEYLVEIELKGVAISPVAALLGVNPELAQNDAEKVMTSNAVLRKHPQGYYFPVRPLPRFIKGF